MRRPILSLPLISAAPALLALALFTLCPGDAAHAQSATGHPAAGFIYGTATWPDGHQATGFIRWEGEEAFWDDLFHTGYRENPWLEHLDIKRLMAQRRKEFYATHGLIDRLAYALEEDDKDPVGWRMLLIRMGDIRHIEIHDGEDDFLITADGSRHQIGGYANDAGSDLLIYSGQDEPLEVEWNDLTSLDFLPVPADAVPYGERAYGVVQSSAGTFEGFVQWDVTECVSVDILDGRLDGKNKDFLLGEVRSLARARGRNATVVELKTGEQITLGGSNDLDSGNRGIFVENPAWGRLLIPWKRFEKVTFVDGKGSGPGRDTYRNEAPLRGTVTDADGRRWQGRIIYDADEGWNWDIFNGKTDDLEYFIPFHLIRSISPLSEDTCRVVLRNGRELVLGEDQDTGTGNAGVVVLPGADAEPVQLAWPKVKEIRLEP